MRNFVLENALRIGGDTEIWRAKRRTDDLPVLLCFPSSTDGGRLELARYHHEFELLCALDCAGVPQARGLEEDPRGPVLVLADDGDARSLEDLSSMEGPLPLRRFLELAIKLAEAVGELHQAGVIHRALRPRNVLVAYDERWLRLLDLGRATRIPLERQPYRLATGQIRSSALPYLAPEQTGRMNRMLDHRADLYSLGIIFYELLSGRVPFVADDMIGWIHAHIAIAPAPLSSVVSGIPPVLDALVMRLLSKEAESRYQNPFALVADLQELSRRLDGGEPLQFEIGQTDRSGRLRLSQKLYGRRRQAKRLVQICENAAGGGRQLALISGYSGIGKTALVQETHPRLVSHRGHFAAGKFEQYDRATPFSAIREAFAAWVPQLVDGELGEPWRSDLLVALGPDLPILRPVLPELELLIGPLPLTAAVGGDLDSDRVQLAFCNLFAALCRPEHPLVLFLDDLQWADHASLGVLERLTSSDELRHVLLIGAYRDNEVGTGHPLVGMMARLREQGAPLTEIELAPLSVEHLALLLSDSFGCELEACEAFAKKLLERTGGNPFFVRQYIEELYREGALRFDFRDADWQWHLPEDDGASANVVDLLVRRLERLAPETVECLRLAACLGNGFDLAAFARIRETEPHVALKQLWPAIESRMLIAQEGRAWIELGEESAELLASHAREISFRFRHDRVQEGAYSLLSETERPALHLRVARLMRDNPELDPDGFAVVVHYNHALEELADDDERFAVAELNLRASRRAAGAMAHDAVVRLSDAGLEVLGHEDLPGRDALRAKLFAERGQGLSRLGRFDAAESAYQSALEHSDDEFEQIEIRTRCMEMYVAQGRIDEARDALVSNLGALGIELTQANVKDVAGSAASRVLEARQGRSPEEVVTGAVMLAPRSIALMEVLGRSIDTAYMSGREWVVAVTSIAVCTALRDGVTVSASMSFATYGLVDAEAQTAEGIDRRAEYGRMGLSIARRFGALDWVSRSGVSNPQHYDGRFGKAVERFDAAARAGWDSGALTWGAYGEVRTLFMMWSAGMPLERLEAERVQRHARIDRASRLVSAVCAEALREAISSLRGQAGEPSVLGADPVAEAELEQRANALGPWAACKFYSLKQFVAVVHGKHAAAERAGHAVQRVGHGLLGMTHEHLHHLSTALTCAARHREHETDEHEGLCGCVLEVVAFFEARATTAPDFRAGLLLARGLVAEAGDDAFSAVGMYNRAVVAARASGQHHLAGLANERAAEAADLAGMASLSTHYLSAAADDFSAWGAWAKVDELNARRGVMTPARGNSRPSIPFLAQQLPIADAESLFKACRAISSEVRLDVLLRKQMEIVLENGGAQRALLILERGGTLYVEAEAHVEAGGVQASVPASPLDDRESARALIEHAFRTGEPVRVEDVSEPGRFVFGGAKDALPKCVLAVPVESKGKRLGVLLLEHHSATRAFPTQIDGVLSVLVVEIATSLENAFLFRDLEKQVEERTRAERVLRAERGYSALVVDRSPLIMGGVSADGVTLLMNTAGERITGLSRADVVGTDWWHTFHDATGGDDRSALDGMLERARRVGGVQRCDTWLRTSTGERRLISWTSVDHRSETDQLLQRLYFGADITDAYLEHAKNEALEASLLHAQRLESIGTLASGIAHDLNNLLVPIVGYATMLEEDFEDSPDALESIQEILAASTRATALVRQILYVNRKRATVSEPVQITAVASEVAGLIRASLPGSIEVRTSLADPCPKVLADPSEVHQVILNLTTNAGHAMRDGGVLNISVKPVVVDDAWLERHPEVRQASCLRLTVSDTGHGIDDATMRRIYDPFFTTKEAGSGLGLWVVHGIISRVGGAIEVESEPGVGTSVSLYFPVHDGGEESDITPSAAPSVQGAEHILLVDDEKSVLAVLDQMLVKLGYRVSAFSEPLDALRAFEAEPSAFDIVVTDFSMPSLSGDRLAERLVAIRPNMPILLASGVGVTLDGTRLGSLGIRAIIQKPARAREYAAAIRAALSSDE